MELPKTDLLFESILELLGEAKFSDSNMVITHNLRGDNLEYAHENFDGYLPPPSLAIQNTENGLMSSYGGVILFKNPKDFDYNKARIFESDIYSTRVPSIQHVLDLSGYKKLMELFESKHSVVKDIYDSPYFGDDFNRFQDEGLKSFWRSELHKLIYLLESEIPMRIPKKKEDLDKKFKKRQLKDNNIKDPTTMDDETAKRLHSEFQLRSMDGDDELKEVWFKEYMEKDLGSRLSMIKRDYSNSLKVDKSNIDDSKLREIVNKKIDGKKSNTYGYKKWVSKTFKPFIEAKRVFGGFTHTGNRKYKGADIDSITNQMTARNPRSKEGFNYGLPNLRAQLAKPIKDLKTAVSKKGLIVSRDKMDEIKDEQDKRFYDISEEFEEYHVYGGGSSNSLISVMAGNDSYREVFPDAPRDLIRKAEEFKQELSKTPTQYFEIKYNKKVNIGYFDFALIPRGIDPDVKKILTDYEIPYKTYTGDSPNVTPYLRRFNI